MPRFYFDVVWGEGRIDDVAGRELADLDAARLAGLDVMRETLALFPDASPDVPVLEIRDETGALIERVPRPDPG